MKIDLIKLRMDISGFGIDIVTPYNGCFELSYKRDMFLRAIENENGTYTIYTFSRGIKLGDHFIATQERFEQLLRRAATQITEPGAVFHNILLLA